MDFEEYVFVGIGIRHGDFDPPYRIDDTYGNFQEFEAYGIWNRFCQWCILQSLALDTVDEDISKPSQYQAELIGVVVMGAHAIPEQVKLTILDPVFHIPPWTIYILAKFFR